MLVQVGRYQVQRGAIVIAEFFVHDMCRYKPSPTGTVSDDPTPEYMNLLGMIFSMCGLMLKVCNAFVHSVEFVLF